MKTYVVTFTNVALIAGDFLTLAASPQSGQLIRIARVKLGPSLATALGYQNISALIRSQAPTAGTSTTPAVGTFDSTDPGGAAQGVVKLYSAAPTIGGTASTIRVEKLFSQASGGATVGNTILWTFDGSRHEVKFPILRGPVAPAVVSDTFCLNCDAAAAGQLVDGEIQWLED